MGLNLSFGLSEEIHTSDIMLTPVENPVVCNCIAIASQDFKGAYRFESAYFRYHFLAFCPPTQIQMVGTLDEFSVVDFVLTDFDVCEKFKTLDEIMSPFVAGLGGEDSFIPLERL